MFDYYNLNSDVPDVSSDRIREDFNRIFERNTIQVELIKHRIEDDPENADFFGTRTPSKVNRKKIKLFITATISDSYKRREQGIVTNDSTFKAYATHNTVVDNNDMIKFLRTTKILDFNVKRGQLFIIQEHNKSFYHGQFCFQEFNLKRVDLEQQ